MSRIIHMQTTIQTVFGVLDEEGNALAQQPVTVNVALFNEKAFAEAFAAIGNARDQAIASMPAAPTARNGNGNRAQRRAAAKPKRA